MCTDNTVKTAEDNKFQQYTMVIPVHHNQCILSN